MALCNIQHYFVLKFNLIVFEYIIIVFNVINTVLNVN